MPKPQIHPVWSEAALPSHPNCLWLSFSWSCIFSGCSESWGRGESPGAASCSAPPDGNQTIQQQSFGIYLWIFLTSRAARGQQRFGGSAVASRAGSSFPRCPGKAVALSQPGRAVPAVCHVCHQPCASTATPAWPGNAGLLRARIPPHSPSHSSAPCHHICHPCPRRECFIWEFSPVWGLCLAPLQGSLEILSLSCR